MRASLRGLDRPVEVVDDLEQIDEDGALAALDFLRDVSPRPGPRLLELGRGGLVLLDVVLQHAVLLGEPALELFDVGRLAGRTARRLLARLAARPPAAVDDFHLGGAPGRLGRRVISFIGHGMTITSPTSTRCWRSSLAGSRWAVLAWHEEPGRRPNSRSQLDLEVESARYTLMARTGTKLQSSIDEVTA